MNNENSPGPAGSSKRNDTPQSGDGLSGEAVSRPVGAGGKHEPIEWRGIRFEFIREKLPAALVGFREPSQHAVADSNRLIELRYYPDVKRFAATFGGMELWGDSAEEALEAARSQVESIARAVGLIPDLEELSEYVAAIREALELEGYQPEGAALSAINDIAAKLGAKP